ncbi:shikimate dehydrogenase [Clostridium sp. SM-530-WT-3G]|uniref:shikimate dehydrogenase n=1 Tax=Clostridium sp. SM-530-WT-3G TaxID=2725303 RepID=UPI00145C5FC3|nr:shikimate dehydrogenase [Clostridium sp. SM-530-WT-3G]
MEFYGVLGEKLPHTISPEIHEQVFSLLNIKGAYKKFEVEKDDLCKVAESLRVLKIKGTNVTIPYKQDIMKYLDEISEEAKNIGAINTINFKDNKLYGYNTDYYGFGTIIDKNNLNVNNKIVMVLGTGGASKAVVTYLLDKGVTKVYLISRSERKESGYEDSRVECRTYEAIKDLKGYAIVNTTPVGMYPHIDVSPVEEDVIQNFDVLIDIIYNPRKTKFLDIGEKLNKKICGGLEMLVGQAIKSEEIWQEMKISNEIFDKVYSHINKNFK